ncbi:MAG: DUF1697 domain-containing protein [Anaerolineales bacterium]
MVNTQYLALLRGINVGGGNIIKMADLKACLEKSGFENVVTYIQSGNVLFESGESDHGLLTRQLEQAVSAAFPPYQARIVLRTHAQLRQVVAQAPQGFGEQPQTWRYDVIYLKEPLTAADAMQHVPVKPGVDEAFTGTDVLYFSRLIARASQSGLTKIVGSPIYQDITIRNWNTTSKLLALMDTRTRA